MAVHETGSAQHFPLTNNTIDVSLFQLSLVVSLTQFVSKCDVVCAEHPSVECLIVSQEVLKRISYCVQEKPLVQSGALHIIWHWTSGVTFLDILHLHIFLHAIATVRKDSLDQGIKEILKMHTHKKVHFVKNEDIANIIIELVKQIYTHKYSAIVSEFQFHSSIIVPLYHNTDNSASFLLIISYPLWCCGLSCFPSTQINVMGPRAGQWAMKHAWLIEKSKEIKTILLLNRRAQKVMKRHRQQCCKTKR